MFNFFGYRCHSKVADNSPSRKRQPEQRNAHHYFMMEVSLFLFGINHNKRKQTSQLCSSPKKVSNTKFHWQKSHSFPSKHLIESHLNSQGNREFKEPSFSNQLSSQRNGHKSVYTRRGLRIWLKMAREKICFFFHFLK